MAAWPRLNLYATAFGVSVFVVILVKFETSRLVYFNLYATAFGLWSVLLVKGWRCEAVDKQALISHHFNNQLTEQCLFE